MRVVAGKYRGIIFDTTDGLDVRPTTDRVREAMFSSLISIYGSLEDANVLDLFSGSGALSFEAISRGAKKATLFEKNRNTYKNILRNIQKFKTMDNCKVLNTDVFTSYFDSLTHGEVYDIVFCDPPYKMPALQILELLKNLKKLSRLSNRAIIIYEHSSKQPFEDIVKDFEEQGFVLKRSKKYGQIACEYLALK